MTQLNSVIFTNRRGHLHRAVISIVSLACVTAGLAPIAIAQTTSVSAETVSDMLIVLDSDGRSHTVQHTVATDQPILTLELPGSVIPQEVMFFGPDKELLLAEHKENPSVVKLSSGSAFARYQHQYGIEVQQLQPGYFALTTPSIPANIQLNNHTLTRSSISWVFPNEFELVSYSATDLKTGRWVVANNTLTFHNSGNTPVDLSINYKKNAGAIVINTSDCTNLDATARNLLDSVAHAISKSNNSFYEIGAHTDNEGGAQNNKLLSQKRADAVRHYLLLKGVDPNALRASGYGEQYPIRDNASAEGRRANRRVELVVIQ